MKNKIIINNPCPESWDNMQSFPKGKFCEKCSKCIIDFTDKTDDQIEDIFNAAKGKEICGRIFSTSFSKLAAGIILVTNLSFSDAQIIKSIQSPKERNISTVTRLSGKLIFKRTKQEISDAEVYFISKKKYFKALTDKNGNFVLEIPDDYIERKNVLYFDFTKLNSETLNDSERKVQSFFNADIYENTSIIFTKKEKINDQEFQIDSEHAYIGAVVIMPETPPDYYYFNGKSISEKKFERLKKETPNYQYFFFEGKEAEIIARKSYLSSLQLLFSD